MGCAVFIGNLDEHPRCMKVFFHRRDFPQAHIMLPRNIISWLVLSVLYLLTGGLRRTGWEGRRKRRNRSRSGNRSRRKISRRSRKKIGRRSGGWLHECMLGKASKQQPVRPVQWAVAEKILMVVPSGEVSSQQVGASLCQVTPGLRKSGPGQVRSEELCLGPKWFVCP